MAASTNMGVSTLLIIVSVFVINITSAQYPCIPNDTEYPYRCVLNDTFVQRCCSSNANDDDCALTRCSETDKESQPELMNVTEIVLANLTLENCPNPLVIECIMTVEISNVTFRGFTDTVLDIFDVWNILVDNCTFENNSNNGRGNATFRGNAGAIAIGYSDDSKGDSKDDNSTDADSVDAYTIIIKNSTFINNTANTNRSTDEVLIQKLFAGRGGAIALYLPTPNSIVRFTSESNCFMNNRVTAAGGAIYAHLSGDFADVTLHVKDCNFTGNDAPDGAGIEFTYDLNKSACIISSCDIDNNTECSSAPTTDCPRHVPATSIIENCNFVGNNGSFGGAFKGIQINPFGNNNIINFKNCTFINNTASVGAAAYFQSRYSVADVRMNDSIHMENCTFMSNTGPRSIVFMIRNRVDFIGCNKFMDNTGPSIRLVGTLVVFSGMVHFVNNRHHSEGLSGALYLSSFGQMLLEKNVTLNFTDNLGSDGAAIVVKSPRVSSSFSRQLYNPQCFLQYADATESPYNWTARMHFAGNKARVGPVMFVSNLAACEWYSINSSRYFEPDNLERWRKIVIISDDHCNCIMNSTNNCSDNSVPCTITKNLIQTELSSLNVTSNTIEKSPGENVRVGLDVFDERNSSTIAFLKIDVPDDGSDTQSNCNVTFEPSIIPVSPEDSNINFKFRISTEECLGESINILISAPFAINPVEPRNFTLKILNCLPGFKLDSPTDNYRQCICNTDSDVLYCSLDQTTILLKDGTWAANPNVNDNKRTLITSPCPARYCECNGLNELTRSGCALNFSKSICVDDRKGWLCGECNQRCNESEKTGIGVLTTKCRCSGDAMYRYLVPLVVMYGVVSTFIVVLVNHPFPSSLKGILYYIQVSAICTQFIPEDFNIEWEIMDCIANALSFYYPYDFDFKPGLDAISAYGLRYIPIAIVIIIAPIALWIRTRFKPKMVFEGIWTLVLLTYAHLVYTSSSIVNCHQLGDKTRWFINGSILCYKNDHLGLSFLAIISLIFAAALILFTALIVYHHKIKYVSKLPDRVQLMATNLRSTLIKGYRPNYVFWPVVELLRRFIFITAVVLTPGDLTVPLLLTLIVFGAHVFVYPYEDKLSNHIESFVLFVLITVLMLGNTTAVVETTRDTSEDEKFFVLLFVPIYVAIVLFICYLIYKLCYLMMHRFNIDIKSWSLARRSGLLNKRRNIDTDSTPQVTCTHIDLGDHDYQPLRPNHDVEDDEYRQTRTSRIEDDEN